jgi:hypothetical protein
MIDLMNNSHVSKNRYGGIDNIYNRNKLIN